MMNWHITEKTEWILTRKFYGEEVWVPPHQLNGRPILKTRTAHGAQLYMSTCMDCTPWTLHDTIAEAARYLLENYNHPMKPENRTRLEAIAGVIAGSIMNCEL